MQNSSTKYFDSYGTIVEVGPYRQYYDDALISVTVFSHATIVFFTKDIHEPCLNLPIASEVLGVTVVMTLMALPRRSQSMCAKAYGSVLFSASNLNLFMGFCRKDIRI